jgi:molecular chaperone GrpE
MKSIDEKTKAKKSDLVLELEKQLETKQTLYLRALADYQNLERRTQTQVASDRQNFLFGFFRDLIEIKNDLDTAEIFNQDEGLKLIRNKFSQFFSKQGISEFNPEGAEFNPEQMECVQLVAGKSDHRVVKVLEKGYLYKNELIKPAKVVVSKLEVSLPTEE